MCACVCVCVCVCVFTVFLEVMTSLFSQGSTPSLAEIAGTKPAEVVRIHIGILDVSSSNQTDVIRVCSKTLLLNSGPAYLFVYFI